MSDDCWMLPNANRSDGGQGPQVPDPSKFPSNLTLPELIQYAHAKRLKFGLYTARASTTCQRMAGSCNHEQVDAKQFAEWKLDVSTAAHFASSSEASNNHHAVPERRLVWAVPREQRHLRRQPGRLPRDAISPRRHGAQDRAVDRGRP